jgi:proteasome lid subunit RPN8/RPN11
VFVSEQAFIALVAAATEAYRRECYGVLLGTRRLGRVYVLTAFAYQTARRTPKSAQLVDGRRRTVRQVLRAFPKYDYIGEFHSHPGYGDEPGRPILSDSDLVGVRPGECELVVAVRRARARVPWAYCADGSLSGVAGKHFLKLRAYLTEPMRKEGVRGRSVGLRCSYAVGAASSRRLLAKRGSAPGP